MHRGVHFIMVHDITMHSQWPVSPELHCSI